MLRYFMSCCYTLRYFVLCCIVLYCVVLCCVTLCCVVLCYVALCCVTLCCVVLRCVTLCYVVLSVLCCVVFCVPLNLQLRLAVIGWQKSGEISPALCHCKPASVFWTFFLYFQTSRGKPNKKDWRNLLGISSFSSNIVSQLQLRVLKTVPFNPKHPKWTKIHDLHTKPDDGYP